MKKKCLLGFHKFVMVFNNYINERHTQIEECVTCGKKRHRTSKKIWGQRKYSSWKTGGYAEIEHQ